jgi:hypothetical protein
MNKEFHSLPPHVSVRPHTAFARSLCVYLSTVNFVSTWWIGATDWEWELPVILQPHFSKSPGNAIVMVVRAKRVITLKVFMAYEVRRTAIAWLLVAGDLTRLLASGENMED